MKPRTCSIILGSLIVICIVGIVLGSEGVRWSNKYNKSIKFSWPLILNCTGPIGSDLKYKMNFVMSVNCTGVTNITRTITLSGANCVGATPLYYTCYNLNSIYFDIYYVQNRLYSGISIVLITFCSIAILVLIAPFFFHLVDCINNPYRII
jgi:hypothetical protein